MSHYKDELLDFISQHLPAVQLLQFSVEEASPERVILSAPLSVNINDKLTAFGGSQQMLALTCTWSLVYVNMIHTSQKDQQFVVARVDTRYRKPVRSERFYAVAHADSAELSTFSEQAKLGNSTRMLCASGVYESLEEVLQSDLNQLESSAASYLQASFATTGAK